MAKFTILRTRHAADPKLTEFTIQMQSGSLAAADVFFCYETHHSVKVTVMSFQPSCESLLIIADTDGWFGHEDQWVGAVVDTEGKTRNEAFRYPNQNI
jgi:hypothetical protein